jgi:FlaA1/EpsC-like NDP-sugar epimerase
LILLIDIVIVTVSFCLSLVLKNKLELKLYDVYYTLLYSSITVVVFLFMGIHTRIIRYSNTRDMLRIFIAALVCNIIFLLVCKMLFAANFKFGHTDLAEILLINFFISSSLLMGMRIIAKDVFKYLKLNAKSSVKENVLVYGSDAYSVLIKKAIEGQKMVSTQVVGFIDFGSDKVYKCIEQKHVYPVNAIGRLKQKFDIKKMLVTAEELKQDGKRKAVEKCIELGIKVITVPPSDQWLNELPNLNQFKDLKIEDLLQREPIELCKEHISGDLKNKRILVTGAAGSIGSEIVRQVLSYDPELVVLCDQAETPLHNIQLEMEESINGHKTRVFISDIQNTSRINTLFNLYRPQIVFHAAAYKHVPMMENNPVEAVLTNVWGTKNLADISLEYDVEKFIMISTDKAVRPTNIMGASKRIAEMYIQSLNTPSITGNFLNGHDILKSTSTRLITTRFGNVLGSNGSVIPRFKEQIQRGGPVTVTDPEITRYFMTIPEAVHLVLEAAVMGNGGEIFLFDMGEPVKIADLASKMIRLAGFVPNEDIKIVYTGLRPGEKLYEELLNLEEQVIPTYNKDIKISKTIPKTYTEINGLISKLLEPDTLNDVDAMVLQMKSILPDFISNNSRFEKLDIRVLDERLMNV